MLLKMHVGGSHFDGHITILNVVAEETKLLLPGSKIIIGRMHMQHPKFTNFGKVYSLHFTKTVICTSLTREKVYELPADQKTDLEVFHAAAKSTSVLAELPTLIQNISSQACFLALDNRWD